MLNILLTIGTSKLAFSKRWAYALQKYKIRNFILCNHVQMLTCKMSYTSFLKILEVKLCIITFKIILP